ncbi:cellulose binding domain-containing protein, partial [Streptomyces sp. SP17BM10]|uniref:cellulose binding domain-containing protein n=1 Tax=Streptomyces sp. SP17BM10 TaxID=3002530 RepID=UPI002E7A2213
MPRTVHPRTAALAAATAACAALAVLPLTASAASSAPAPTTGVSCRVSYAVNDWGSGFTANLTITDTGTTAIDGWTLGYAYTGDQTLQNGWNGTWTQTGRTVTV